MNRGEVWWVSFEPSVGGEIRKKRPAVIISNDASNKYLNRYFVLHSKVATGKKDIEISPEAMDLLIAYNWPGNIRELQNVIERALILTEDRYIRPKDLPTNLKKKPSTASSDSFPLISLDQMEKRYILEVLKRCGRHRGMASKILQISESTLYRRLKEYGVLEDLAES